MKVAIKFAFDEQGCVRLLKWLAQWNAELIHADARLPLLYDSHVYYRREQREDWCDVYNTLLQGFEDCDGLASWRAGEVLARGWRAILPGDPGFEVLSRVPLHERPEHISAEPFLRIRERDDRPPGANNQYHCLAAYRIGGQEFVDDPSARLGMYGGRIDPAVLWRWRRAEAGTRAAPAASSSAAPHLVPADAVAIRRAA